MKNLDQLLKQAQQLQEKMQQTQDSIAKTEFSGVAGGGMVKVTLNGTGEMKSVTLDKSLLREDEIEILEDLLMAAHNDARSKLDSYSAEQMGQLSAGLPLSGPKMKFPF